MSCCEIFCYALHLQIIFDLNKQFASRTPSRLPMETVILRINDPAGAVPCLLCPGEKSRDLQGYVVQIDIDLTIGNPLLQECSDQVRLRVHIFSSACATAQQSYCCHAVVRRPSVRKTHLLRTRQAY